MAGEGHLLSRLRALLEGLDDEALTALSSVGLLRRARKDLQSLVPMIHESEEALQVDLGAHKVEFDSRGLAHARCTCPAKTTCQHVLAAWLHLRTLPATAAEGAGSAAAAASPDSGLPPEDVSAAGMPDSGLPPEGATAAAAPGAGLPSEGATAAAMAGSRSPPDAAPEAAMAGSRSPPDAAPEAAVAGSRSPPNAAPASHSVASPDLVSQLLAIPTDSLIKFAGLPAVREMSAAVESSELPAIEIGKQLKIRLPHPPVELRYAGGGLDAFILDYRGKRREKLIVQAVLAFQKANGAQPPNLPASTRRRRAAEGPAAQAAATAPKQLMTQVLATLVECMKLGVLHLSENMAERLLSQAAAAEGADLHRLALALTRLAHHIDLQLGLNAGTSSLALLDELARTYALAAAIHDAATVVPVLWGEARSEYEDIARLELIGVAAEPWRTASGYTGLTILFWSPAYKRWYSATDSRPAGVLGFDPVQRYKMGGPWAGCNSPAQACGARLTLTNARANRAGRLSLSETTRAQVVDLEGWPEFSGREFASWSELQTSVQADTSGVGLSESDPHGGYVVLRPNDWLDAKFDATRQELYRVILDEDGEELALCVRYSALAHHAIERLEALKPKPGSKLLARVERMSSRMLVRPIALLQDVPGHRSDNLFLDEGLRLSAADVLAGKVYDFLKGKRDEQLAHGSCGPAEPAPARENTTQRRLRALEDEILRLAEKGISGLSQDAARIERLEETLRGGGIDLLPHTPRVTTAELPERLLRLKHCLMVVRELQT